MLRQFLGRPLQLGQARGLSAAARDRLVALWPHNQFYPCGTYEIHVHN